MALEKLDQVSRLAVLLLVYHVLTTGVVRALAQGHWTPEETAIPS